jgi:hypothetical protein
MRLIPMGEVEVIKKVGLRAQYVHRVHAGGCPAAPEITEYPAVEFTYDHRRVGDLGAGVELLDVGADRTYGAQQILQVVRMMNAELNQTPPGTL